jgi:hypothetical protein
VLGSVQILPERARGCIHHIVLKFDGLFTGGLLICRASYCPPLVARILRHYRPSSLAPLDCSGALSPRDIRYDFSPRTFQRPPFPRDIRVYPPQSPPACVATLRDTGEESHSCPTETVIHLHFPSSEDATHRTPCIIAMVVHPLCHLPLRLSVETQFPGPWFPPSTEIRDYPPLPPPGRGHDFEGYRRGQPHMLDRDFYPPPPLPELRERYPPDPRIP